MLDQVKFTLDDTNEKLIHVSDADSGHNIASRVINDTGRFKVGGYSLKLDGTAKGGILIALSKKYKIPIVGLGLGEKEDDLQAFNAKQFASAFTQKM